MMLSWDLARPFMTQPRLLSAHPDWWSFNREQSHTTTSQRLQITPHQPPQLTPPPPQATDSLTPQYLPCPPIQIFILLDSPVLGPHWFVPRLALQLSLRHCRVILVGDRFNSSPLFWWVRQYGEQLKRQQLWVSILKTFFEDNKSYSKSKIGHIYGLITQRL